MFQTHLKTLAIVLVTALFSSSALLAEQSNAARPACTELEVLFVELARRSGQEPTQAEIDEAIYDANPTNAECQMMLSLFPKPEDR